MNELHETTGISWDSLKNNNEKNKIKLDCHLLQYFFNAFRIN